MKKVTRRALRGHFHSPVVAVGHGNLRRIRDPSARRHEVRILRLRSQARFVQDDTALRERGRPGPGLASVAKREDSYGPKSGPKAGSRASSPGEQAAACDYQKKLVRWAGEQAAACDYKNVFFFFFFRRRLW